MTNEEIQHIEIANEREERKMNLTDEEVQAMSTKIANDREELAKALLPCNKNFGHGSKNCPGHAEICAGLTDHQAAPYVAGIWVECSHCNRQTIEYHDNDFDACLEWNQLILAEKP